MYILWRNATVRNSLNCWEKSGWNPFGPMWWCPSKMWSTAIAGSAGWNTKFPWITSIAWPLGTTCILSLENPKSEWRRQKVTWHKAQSTELFKWPWRQLIDRAFEIISSGDKIYLFMCDAKQVQICCMSLVVLLNFSTNILIRSSQLHCGNFS